MIVKKDLFREHFPSFIEIGKNFNLQMIDNKNAPKQFQKEDFIFKTDGEIKSFFICSSDRMLESQDFSAFVESMNIVIGNTLSSFEDMNHSIINLTPPLKLKKTEYYLKNDLPHVSYRVQYQNKIFYGSIFYHASEQSFYRHKPIQPSKPRSL